MNLHTSHQYHTVLPIQAPSLQGLHQNSAANQLLAGLGLLAVAAWLGKMGRNNKMFYFPMIFMILVTLTSLVFTIKSQIAAIIAGGTGLAWCYIRAILAILLVILAIDLVVEGSKALAAQAKAKKAENA